MKRYRLEYEIIFKNGNGEMHAMIVSKCDDEQHAKLKLEGYIKQKDKTINTVRITSCEELDERWIIDTNKEIREF